MVNRPNPLPGTRLKPSQLSSYRRASAIARRTYSCAPDRSIQSKPRCAATAHCASTGIPDGETLWAETRRPQARAAPLGGRSWWLDR